MEQKNEHIPSSSCAGSEAGGFKKMDDSAQAEEEEMNEENSESSSKNQGVQTSITEEWTTADEKSSKDDAQEKLPGQNVGKLSSSFYRHHDRNKLPESNRSSPVCSIENKGEIVEKKDRIIPKRAVSHYQDIGRSVPLPQNLAISPPVWVPPCSESTAKSLQETSTAEKQTEQLFPIKLTQPDPLSHSDSDLEFQYSSGIDWYSKSPYKQHLGSLQKESVLHKRRRSLKEFGASERFSPAFVNPHFYSNLTTFPPSQPNPPSFPVYPFQSSWLVPLPQSSFFNEPSEKQTGADEKTSKEDAPVKLQGQNLSSFPRASLGPSTSSSHSRHDCDSWRKPWSPPHSSHSPPYLQHEIRHISSNPLWGSKTKYKTFKKRDQALPKTTVHRDPDIRHSPTSVPFSECSSKMDEAPLNEYAATCNESRTRVPQGLATESSVWVPPCSESTAKSLQETSTAEKQTEQLFPIKLTQPELLSHSDSDLEFQYSSGIDWYSKSPYKQHLGSLQKESEDVLHKRRRSLKEFGASERFSPAFVNPHSYSNPTTFSINPSDSGRLYSPQNRNLKKRIKEISVQSQSDYGGDHRPVEEMRPPVTAKHNSRRKTPVARQKSYTFSVIPVTSAKMLTDPWKDIRPDMTTDPDHDTYGAQSWIYRDNPPSYPVYPSGILPLQSPVPSAPLWSTFISEPLQGNSSASFTKKNILTDRRGGGNYFFNIASLADPSGCTSDQPPPVALTETGTILKRMSAADVSPGVGQENTREKEHVTAGLSTLQLSTSEDDDSDSDEYYDREKERDEMFGSMYNASHPWFSQETESSEYEELLLFNLLLDYDPTPHLPNIVSNAYVSPRDSGYTSGVLTFSQSNIPAAIGCLSQGDSHTVLQDSPVCTKISRKDAFDQSEEESEGNCSAQVEMEASVSAVNLSVTNTLPTCSHLQSSSDPDGSCRDSRCLPRSHSVPSLSPTSSAENQTLTRAQSFPDMPLKNSFEEFTPDVIADGSDESYRFQCSCPGLYQCSATGLVFHMEGGGDVVYRTVPWNRRLLAQHHKQPAGPLFDIKCLQQSVCQLYLPHCEICSTGGCRFLSVAHESNAGIEFISPREITETHVVINITGFSAFGNVKDEDAPPDPVRALVLLFYRPPAAPDPTSLLNVLMLPKNVVLQDVKNKRKKLVGHENYIEMSPHCKLHPQQEYTLSTCPEDDSVLVQPKVAEFECDNYDNYFPSFQVDLEKILKHIHLFLRDANNQSVWERRVCLSFTGVKRPRVQGSSADRLKEIRCSFIDGVSGPVLKNLLDKLLEKNVLIDSERESVDSISDRSDKARRVIDTVRGKGETASSEMIEFLCEVDHILCEHLGLI